MDMQNYRPEFLIYVLVEDDKSRRLFHDSLQNAGFQVESFGSAVEALEKLPQSPPHIVFCGSQLGNHQGIEVLNNLRAMSSDIEVIFLTRVEDKVLGVEALRAGAYDVLTVPVENISELITFADRTMHFIYLRLENEQLREELSEFKNRKPMAPEDERRAVRLNQAGIGNFLDKLTKFSEGKLILQQLVNELSEIAGGKPVIFLKYLPAYSSLAVTTVTQIPWESVKNIGIPLANHNPKEVIPILLRSESFPELRELMAEVFKCTEYSSFTMGIQNQSSEAGDSTGLVIVFDPLDTERRLLCTEFIRAGSLALENTVAKARLHELAVKDPQTGLFNRRYFNEKLEEELNRSRRTRYPVSLIYLDIDHFKKYNDFNGHIMGDVIIKAVSQILLKSSRKTDIAARLGGEEFAILCPHTPAVGAAVKAEKMRLAIAGTKLPHSEKQPGGVISVSVGVSEYPSIASDAQVLMRSADDALYKVKQGGRNRVCLAEPPRGFVPDFEALAVPGFQSLPTRSETPLR